MNNSEELSIYNAGIKAWQDAFNNQDAAGCAAQYADHTTLMVARPFGEFTGHEEIQAFWQQIIDQGFTDVEYTNVTWKPAEGDEGYILCADWTMNKAFGVVHHEHWKIQEDGKARLVFDEFEVQGER
ncbi:isochorismatase [Enterovibrio norvegicus]|uniref:SnoaL-like domain-containing protein n=2 Tax=Enterovibrio norvegicus TaxID=188144 RepID=A0A1I5LZS4_9GAMM|nr:nuclear transport factor 2 family protein [Enterovibrio norvegicus]MCC4798441.1 nuclear transport factor 2 family protein [Enterovibrio norvegicus]OEE65485.1 isochorismatase [Enterovibrio norvegicus]OEF50930.1 isochorismatase [Enterovibrio norvegicus]OEF55809.1 isochorismatase [Enterovibrio norvegicus]PMH64921.1 isochorismatase [Enterovibrio norvegicus]